MLSWQKSKILAETVVKARNRRDMRNELKVVKSHLRLWSWGSVKLELGILEVIKAERMILLWSLAGEIGYNENGWIMCMLVVS